MPGEAPGVVAIDGYYGEGGGAVVQTSLAMSALTRQPVKIQNVRAGTNYPGLDVEDLTLINGLKAICRAKTVGAELGSHSVSFFPSDRLSGFTGEVPSFRNESKRGPNALVVLTALIPILATSGMYSSLCLEGETFGNGAIGYDYFANVTLAAFRRAGVYAFPDHIAAGFGRESVGKVAVDVEPCLVNGVSWQSRGGLRACRAVVTTNLVPDSVGKRIVAHLKLLGDNSGLEIGVRHVQASGSSPGAFVTVWAEYERGFGAGTAMGAIGLRSETLAQRAFQELFDWMAGGSTTDPYLADQLLLLLSIADTPSDFSVSRLTKRFMTLAGVIKQFTPVHITVRGVEGGPGEVTIQRP